MKSIVFEPIQDIYNAKKDPELFLNSFSAPLILDEAQYVPQLLAALKKKWMKKKRRGLKLLAKIYVNIYNT